jgi:hypothetical protein
MPGNSRKSELLVHVLDKLEKLSIQEGILVVLLSIIFASMILILVPLVQLFAFPFMVIYVIFVLRALHSLPEIRSSQKEVDTKPTTGENLSTLLETSSLKNAKEEIERAVVLRHVFHNSESSVFQVASAIRIHENIVRTHLQNLLKKQLIIKHVKNFVDRYSANYDNFNIIVSILRSLTTLEENLKDFSGNGRIQK